MPSLFTFPHRPRPPLLAGLALGMLAFWLMLLAAEVHAPLHRWFHGGAIPHEDACAIAQFVKGKLAAIPLISLARFVPIVLIVIALSSVLPFSFQRILPPGRGPPALSPSV